MIRLQSEVDEVLSDKKYVSPEDLEKLEYTEQVYKQRNCINNSVRLS